MVDPLTDYPQVEVTLAGVPYHKREEARAILERYYRHAFQSGEMKMTLEKTNEQKNAFPHPSTPDIQEDGLTKLEYVSTQMLAALIANPEFSLLLADYEAVADIAVKAARELLRKTT